jgi:hypothetical protein
LHFFFSPFANLWPIKVLIFWEGHKTLWPSQNIWTLKYSATVQHYGPLIRHWSPYTQNKAVSCCYTLPTTEMLSGKNARAFLIFIYFFKYKTIETHARAFLPLNISAVVSVARNSNGLNFSAGFTLEIKYVHISICVPQN